jgi:ABC-type multidrug transport system permease subunit
LWFAGGALAFSVIMYSIAEIVATQLPSPEEYIGVVPAIAIVPWFFGGSLFPITALPAWLADIAKVLPLTHALALFRYGLTATGAQALQNIWGMSNDTVMACLSLGVLVLYGALFMAGALIIFARSGKS